MTKEQILALIKKGSVTVTGLLEGEEVTSEHIKNMEKDQFYENYVGHTGVYDLDKKEEGETEPVEPVEPEEPVDPTEPIDQIPDPVEPEEPVDPAELVMSVEPEEPVDPAEMLEDAPVEPGVPDGNEPDPVDEFHVMPKDYVPPTNDDKVAVETIGAATGTGRATKPAKANKSTKKSAAK